MPFDCPPPSNPPPTYAYYYADRTRLSRDDADALKAEANADFNSGDLKSFLAKQRKLQQAGYALPVPCRCEQFPYVRNDIPASVRYGCITE